MAGDCGLNALSLLPENVLPQWQQKIALRAEVCIFTLLLYPIVVCHKAM